MWNDLSSCLDWFQSQRLWFLSRNLEEFRRASISGKRLTLRTTTKKNMVSGNFVNCFWCLPVFHLNLFPDPSDYYYHRGDPLPPDYYLSFQPDGKLSNRTFASYLGTLHEMGEMTICYWFNLHYHHQTISLASYCAPARNCTAMNKNPKCSNIRTYVGLISTVVGKHTFILFVCLFSRVPRREQADGRIARGVFHLCGEDEIPTR